MWWNLSRLVEYRNMSRICATQYEYFDRIPTLEPRKVVDNENVRLYLVTNNTGA